MTPQFTVRIRGVGHQRVIQRIGIAQNDINVTGSSAFASVREWDRYGDQGHLGDARMYVCNIVVGPSYVDVWLQIDWNSDLEYEITLLIVNLT
jgi:hypothetical protein